MTRRAFPFLLAWLAAAPASADEPPSFTVTTDTPAYCAQLQHQVAERHSVLPDVQRLLAEGTNMCARGEIRGGIRHLRHALVMLHHHHIPRDAAARDAAKDTAMKAAAPTTKPPPAPN